MGRQEEGWAEPNPSGEAVCGQGQLEDGPVLAILLVCT